MKKDIVIFGSGDHSKIVFFELSKYREYNILGFVDNYYRSKQPVIFFKNQNYYNLGNIKLFFSKIKKKYKTTKFNIYGIIGVGLNYNRKKIRNEVEEIDKNFKWEKLISKNSILNGKVNIGEGTLIMSGVVINNNTKIGKHCIINSSSSIDHDNSFKDFSSCGPGVVTGGGVKVGENSYLGIGCVIKNNIKIGKNTVIGGNSFVNQNCLSNSTYIGTPCKKINKKKEGTFYL